ARVVLADLRALEGEKAAALAAYREVLKDFPQSPLAPGRILALRRTDPGLVPDQVAVEMVDLITLTQPEDPEMVLTAAEVAATLEARKNDAAALFNFARQLYRNRGNDTQVEKIKERQAKL